MDAVEGNQLQPRIEKCLAQKDGCSSRSIYDKTEYAEQRRQVVDNCTTHRKQREAADDVEE
jgi:hypothetical protein